VLYGYDWKRLLEDYLFKGDHPLFNNLICGRKLRFNTLFMDALAS